MTVEELIEELSSLPSTAVVIVEIAKNEDENGDLQRFVETRDVGIVGLRYDRANVFISLDE